MPTNQYIHNENEQNQTNTNTTSPTQDGTYTNIAPANKPVSSFDSFVTQKDTNLGHSGFSLNDSIKSTQELLETKTESGFKGTPLPYSFRSEDGITSLMLLSFIFVASVYRKGVDFIHEMTHNLFEASDRSSFMGSTTINEFRLKAFLLIQSTTLLSIFTFIIIYLSSNGSSTIIQSGRKIFVCIVIFIFVIFIFWGFKWLSNNLIGRIFFDIKKVNIWQNNYFSIIELLGISLFPVLLFLVKSQYEILSKICIFLILIFIGIGFILSVYKGFRVFLTKVHGIFYFMLYLCALEILPYLGLYMGLKYIYNLVEFNTLWP